MCFFHKKPHRASYRAPYRAPYRATPSAPLPKQAAAHTNASYARSQCDADASPWRSPGGVGPSSTRSQPRKPQSYRTCELTGYARHVRARLSPEATHSPTPDSRPAIFPLVGLAPTLSNPACTMPPNLRSLMLALRFLQATQHSGVPLQIITARPASPTTIYATTALHASRGVQRVSPSLQCLSFASKANSSEDEMGARQTSPTDEHIMPPP